MSKTKTTFKRITSLLLSLVFVISSFCAVDFSKSTAIEAKADEADDYYMFAYFTGNANSTVSSGGNQAIRFALSTDGRNFKALNDNNPTINQTGGSLNVRDPYLFKGADGYYYIIGTDLDCITMGWWGNQPQMVIWRSADLVNWDHETYINAAQICGLNNNQVHRTWAPEVFYDESSGKYMVYFAFAADGYNSTNMYYMLTDDLLDQSKYSQPQQLYRPYDDPANPCYQNNNKDCIDADITYQNGTYYMFYKDEGASTVCLATSTELTGPYSYVGKCATTSETANIEGCQVYKIGNDYHLVADRFSAAGRFAIYNLGSDLSAITASGGSIAMDGGSPISTVDGLNGFQNISPRHGSIIHINKTQYDALITKYGISTDDDIRYCFDREYTAENSWHYDGLLDASGYSYDMMTNTGGYSYVFSQTRNVSLHNTVMFVNDAAVKQMFTDNKSWSVSFNAVVNETHNTTLFALFSGDTPSTTTDWIRFLDNGKLVLYYDGAYHEVGSTTITTSVNYKYDITYNGSKIVVYQNGKEVISSNLSSVNFDITKPEAHIAFGWTDTVGATGIWGSYSNLRFRNRAITPAEVDREYTDNASHQVYRYNEGTNPTVDGRDQVTYNNPQTSTTYSGKNGNSFTISSWVNIGAAKNNNCTLFEFGSGGTGDDKNYLGMLETGEFRYCWSSGSTPHYVDINTGYNFAVNTWYFLQINVVPDGNIQHFRIWVNGVSIADQFNNYNDMNLYDHSPIHMLSQTSFPLYFGKGHAYWTDDGYNLIDDFRVYNRALDPAELFSEMKIEDVADEARDYVRANLESYDVTAAANKFTAPAYHQGVVATNSYSNVLWDPINSTQWNSKNRNGSSDNGYANINTDGDKGLGMKMALPANIVLVYDGVNDVALPAVAEVQRRNNVNTRKFMTIYADHSNHTANPAPFEFRTYWKGRIDNNGREGWNLWPADVNSTDYVGFAPYNDKEDDFGNSDQNPRYYSNKLYYNGSGNTANYYETYSNLVFWIYASSNSSGYSSTKFYNESNNVYILNYKPIYDILKSSNPTAMPNGFSGYGLKQMYTLFIKDNESNYTEDSLNQFYYAAYKVLTCNPNDYGSSFTSSNCSTKVSEAANEIKQAVEEFNNINLKTRADFSALDTAYDSANDVIDTLGTNSQTNTTTSINALSDAISGLTYEPNDGRINRANLSAELFQDDIDSETDEINSAITALDPIYDFDAYYSDYLFDSDNDDYTSYNEIWQYSTDILDTKGTDDQIYTTSTIESLGTVITNCYYAPVLNKIADRKDIGENKDGAAIATEVNAMDNAIAYLANNAVADYTALKTAYNSADEFLKELESETPIYTSSTLNDLIDAVDDADSEAATTIATARNTAYLTKHSTLEGLTNAITSARAALSSNGLDLSAYEEAISRMKNIDNDIYDYGSEDVDSIITVLSGIIAGDEATYTDKNGDEHTVLTLDDETAQSDVNTATGLCINSLNTHMIDYTINLVEGEYSTDVEPVASDAKYTGEIYTVVSGSEYKGKANSRAVITAATEDTAWYMSYVSNSGATRTRQYQGYGETFSTPLIGNINIYAVQATEEKPNKVTIARQYSDNTSTHGVSSIDFTGGSYTLPEAPAIAYYTFTNYSYNGNTYAVGDTITGIERNIVVNANYTASTENAYAVKVTGVGASEGNLFNDSAKYNQKIEVSGGNTAYAWVETLEGGTERIFSIGKNLTFFVTDSVSITAITEKEFEDAGYVVPKVNLRASGTVITDVGSGRHKLTINGQVVNDSANIIEHGILIGKETDGGTITDDDLVVENTGTQTGFKVLRAKSTKMVGANQFTIGVTTNLTGEFKYRGYAIYQNGDSLVTIYSPVVTDSIS